jgi:hypothetical protein
MLFCHEIEKSILDMQKIFQLTLHTLLLLLVSCKETKTKEFKIKYLTKHQKEQVLSFLSAYGLQNININNKLHTLVFSYQEGEINLEELETELDELNIFRSQVTHHIALTHKEVAKHQQELVIDTLINTVMPDSSMVEGEETPELLFEEKDTLQLMSLKKTKNSEYQNN